MINKRLRMTSKEVHLRIAISLMIARLKVITVILAIKPVTKVNFREST